MSNQLQAKNYLVDKDTVESVKLLINKEDIGIDDLNEIVENLNNYPTLLNSLSLSQVVKLDKLGVDLSPYIREQSVSNMKVFVFKYASDSMERVTRLIDTLNKIESNFYNRYTSSNRYIDPNLALSLINTIQNSISTSVNLLSRLTDNDTLMNLVLDIKQINTTINANSKEENITAEDILPKESRSKLTSLFNQVMVALSEDKADSDITDAEIVSEEVESDK